MAVADHVIEQKLPEHCDACQAQLPVAQAQVQQRRQVLDIPVPRHEVSEYRTLSLVCQCGKLHVRRFPEKGQYDPNILRSYLDTARKHGVGMLEALRAAFHGAPMEFAGSG